MTFTLRFPIEEVARWAARYRDSLDAEAEFETVVAPAVQARGYLELSEFLALCRWKTVRTQSRCAKNPADFIAAVTRIAFSTEHAQLRIEVLTVLEGVGWPTASVIQHFCHPKPYPLLDFRALWSLRTEVPARYDFAFWQEYTDVCRGLAARAKVSMRTLDRALWQYSKEKQR